MINNTFYFQSKEAIQIRKDIITSLEKSFKSNSSRLRNIDNDSLLQDAAEKMFNEIIIDYHHPLFEIVNNKIVIYSNSIIGTLDDKEHFIEYIKELLLQGTITDDNGDDLDIKELSKIELSHLKELSNTQIVSRKIDVAATYVTQFFYLSNRVAMKAAAKVQRQLISIGAKHPKHIIDMKNYIDNNLMTPFLITLVPQSLLMFGQTVENNMPIIFNSDYWQGVNTPFLATNFIKEKVPKNWLFVSTRNLIELNYNFTDILKNGDTLYYLNKNNNKNDNFVDNNYQLYFLFRNRLKDGMSDKEAREVVGKMPTTYPHSGKSIFVDDNKKYFFEIANLSDINV